MRNVFLYMLAVFALTYVCFGVIVIADVSIESTPGFLLLVLGGSSPTIFAFIFAHIEGNTFKRSFYRRLVSFKHGVSRYALALAIPLTIGVCGFLLNQNAREGAQLILWPLFLLSGIVFGGLEEIGWRGYVQAKIAPKNIVVFGLVFGIVWGIWHAPMFFVAERAHSDYAFMPYLLLGMVYSVWMTWLFAKTQSIPLVVLFHAAINATATVGLATEFAHVLTTTIFVISALILSTVLVYMLSDWPHKQKSTHDERVLDNQ